MNANATSHTRFASPRKLNREATASTIPSANSAAITASLRESAAETTSDSNPTSFTRGSNACSAPRPRAVVSAASVASSASLKPRTVLAITPALTVRLLV